MSQRFVSVVVVAAWLGLQAIPVAAAPGGHHPHWAMAANDLGVAPAQRLDHLTVMLARSPDRQRAFADLQRAQQAVGSPLYHHWLTPAQIGQQFGATDADLATVTGWLRDQGFKVLRVSSSRMFVEVAGTTAIATAALGVQFHHYKVGARSLLAIDREPTFPARVAPLVAGITGLVDAPTRPLHVAQVVRATQVGTARPFVADSAGNHYVGVGDFTTIYDAAPVYANQITGTGQTIGIIGRSRVLAADITNFGARMNITMPTPTTIIPPTGVDPGAACATSSCVGGDQEEATLDVQRAGSVAPGAKLELIVSGTSGSDDGVGIALEYAIDNFGNGITANIVTLSFGLCEDTAGQDAANAVDTLFQQAAAQGQTVFVSSGDAAAAGCDTAFTTPPDTQSLGMNYLCASGAATCVGGTEFADSTPTDFWDNTGAAMSYIPEGAWDEPEATGGGTQAVGTGGGQSEFVAMPPYQSGLGPTGATGRLTPDVAFTAAQHDPYFACMAALDGNCVLGTGGTFNFTAFAGTSAAAPSMAGVMALIDQTTGANQGAANVRLYQLAAAPTNGVFHDVTVASSGVGSCDVATPSMCNNSDPSSTGLTGGQPGFPVATGYDEATGWGSVDIANLVASWAGGTTTPALTIDPPSLTIAAGASGTVMLEPSGFLTTVTFACSGQPTGDTCTFATDSMGKPTLTIQAAGPTAGPVGLGTEPGGGTGAIVIIVGLGFAALVTRVRRGRRFAAVLAIVATTVLLSCGSNSNGTGDGGTGDGHSGDGHGMTDGAGHSTTTSVTVTAIGGGGETASAMLSLTVTSP